MSDYYEIDFLEVHSSKSGDAIGIRYQINNLEYIHVVDGGYLETGKKLAAHINKFYNSPAYIDHVVVTHPDGDHAAGLREILEVFDVGTLWMLRPWEYADELIDHFKRFQSVENLKTRLREIYPNISKLEEIALEKGIEIKEPFVGAQIGEFHVLAPSKSRYLSLIIESEKTPESHKMEPTQESTAFIEVAGRAVTAIVNFVKSAWGAEVFSPEETSSENDMSVVQYAELCKERILLTGDAGRASLTEAADYAASIGIQLPGIKRFQVPHHGSRRNVSTEVLNRWLGEPLPVQPADGETRFTAIVSAAQEDEDHPRKAVLRAMIHRGAWVISTGDGRGTKRTSKNAPARDGWTTANSLAYPDEMEE